MLRNLCTALAGTLIVAGTANAGAILFLSNEEGGGTLTIPEGGTGIMQFRLTTSTADSIPVAFVNAFLDASKDNLCVVTDQGCTPFEEGAALEWNGPPLPPDGATYILDSLTIMNESGTSGETEIGFEMGARQPQAFGPPPDFLPYTLAPEGFPPDFPGFLYLGTGNSDNPFIVTKVPEPSSVIVFTLGLGLVGLRRRTSR